MKFIILLVAAALAFQCSLNGSFTTGTLTTISAPLSTGNFNTLPQVAANPTGNALAVWNTNFSSSVILASSFNVKTKTWSAQQQIGMGSNPVVGIDQNGNGVAVWITPPSNFNFNPPNQIFAATFNATTSTWSTPFALSQTGRNTSPTVGVNLVGSVAAAWVNTSVGFLFGATFTTSTTVSQTQLQIPPSTTSTIIGNFPHLGVDQLGNAILIFQNLSNTSIQSFRFTIP